MSTPHDMSPTVLPPLAAGFEPATLERWRGLVETVLKGADFDRKMVSHTLDAIAVEPLYTAADAPRRSGNASDQAAGRGLAAPPTRSKTLVAETEPEAAAEVIADGLTAGVRDVTIRFAAAGQSGLAAERDAITAVLSALPLERLAISIEAGADAIDAGSALLAIATERGAANSVDGIGIDPLGVMARTGQRWLLKPDASGFATALPWRQAPATTLLADARPYHEAGASEVQELAALAATLVAYLRAAEAGGQGPVETLPRVALALALDTDIVLGLAKLRAARRLVQRIAEACGAAAAGSRMRLHTTTSERMMSRRDPWVNTLRVTAATATAMMGRASSVTVLPYTWALGRPDAFARRVARNVAIVLTEEASLGRIADPAGGAWAVERLTERLAQAAWETFQRWEAAGGMQTVLTSGQLHDEIAAVAQRRAEYIATGRLALTGSSAFAQLGDDGIAVTPWPQAPPLPDNPVAPPLLPHRLSAPFERLRDAADAASPRPTMFLASLGPEAEHGARSTWTANFLAAGGIAAIRHQGFHTSADAGLAFAHSGAKVACICAADATIAELGEATAMALKGAGAAHVFVAGRVPKPLADALTAAGVDGALYAGCDAVETLGTIQTLACAGPKP